MGVFVALQSDLKSDLAIVSVKHAKILIACVRLLDLGSAVF